MPEKAHRISDMSVVESEKRLKAEDIRALDWELLEDSSASSQKSSSQTSSFNTSSSSSSEEVSASSMLETEYMDDYHCISEMMTGRTAKRKESFLKR